MKALVKILAKITVGFFVAFLFLEISIRLLSLYSYKIRFFSSNPYQQTYLANVFSWKDIARLFCCQQPDSMINGFKLNSHGYFTPEIPYAKPQGVKRLVLIGDSQAVGVVPYEDNFIRLTEKRMRDATVSGFQAINLGAIGFGPLMEEKILEIEGLKYEPDIVLLAFFVGNDFYDDTVYKDRHRQAKHAFPLWVYQSRAFSFLRNSLRFYIFNITSSKSAPLSPADSGNGADVTTPATQSFSQKEYLYLEKERAEIMKPDSRLYDNLDQVKASILRMRVMSEKAGAKFIVLIIPDEFQVNPILLGEISEARGQSAENDVLGSMSQYVYQPAGIQKNEEAHDYEVSYPQKMLAGFFTENNIMYIDPLPVWEAAEDSRFFYVPRNTHLNVRGNQALSDTISPVITGALSSE